MKRLISILLIILCTSAYVNYGSFECIAEVNKAGHRISYYRDIITDMIYVDLYDTLAPLYRSKDEIYTYDYALTDNTIFIIREEAETKVKEINKGITNE